MSQAAPSQRRRGMALIIIGAVVMLLAIALASVSGARSISGLLSLATQDTFGVPGEQAKELDPGSYVVFARIGSTSVQETVGTPFRPNAITITGPDGSSVPVRRLAGTQRLTLGTDVFAGVAGFDAPTGGRYVVRISEGSGTALVSGDIASTVIGGVGGIFGFVIGIFLGFIGLALLIAGLVRRLVRPSAARVGAVPAPALMPPAGWYPDPGRPGAQRYWDGTTWTEHHT